MSALNRRRFMAGMAGTAALTGFEQFGPFDGAKRSPAPAVEQIEVSEGTNIAGRLSPDESTIAFDLLGVLWLLPATGGRAQRLTTDFHDIAQPDWSPDGQRLAFQSYRDGNYDIYTINRDGSGLRKLTSGPFDHREPRFSPDGEHIVFSSDRSGSYGIHLIDLKSSAITAVTDTPTDEYEPTWSPNGEKIAFVVLGSRVDVVRIADSSRSTAVSVAAGQLVRSPEWTPDSADLVHTVLSSAQFPGVAGSVEIRIGTTPLVTGQDVFPFRVSWHGNDFLYAADGALRRRSLAGNSTTKVPFTAEVGVQRANYRKKRRDFTSVTPKRVIGIGSPMLSPDGSKVAFRALNDIYTMPFGANPQPLTGDSWWKQDPAWSPDGRFLSYSTDRAGKLDIWLRDLTTGKDRQLTNLPNAAAVSGSWSWDSKSLAFLDQAGALYTVDVASGAIQRVFGSTFEPGKPTWSPDGTVIALAAVMPYSARFREGLSAVLLVNRLTGAARYVEPAPHRSIQTRGDDGPVWSPDGTKMAFVVGSVLQIVNVLPDGTPVGTPRQVTTEVTDAPSWHGDSKSLLYLNNGRLRLVSADGGTPIAVPMRLGWTNAVPRGRRIIRAGRMWDGHSMTLRSNVDVVIDGNRISAVRPIGPSEGAEVIDARDGVVIPGLVDIHHHREMQGYGYGDRQGRLWLSMGVTTTRSPCSPAYQMAEEREAIQSGRRIGPRYFATGEAIDGSRIFYDFMRPTYDREQLQLELERAHALDYDLMKCYVRLRPEWQKEVIEWAHDHHLLATSHYHYPALGFAGDGVEHIGATSRLGYSRTVSHLGRGYQDVIDLFTKSGAARTPTLFGSSSLYRDDTSLVTDERVRTLYPSWEYAALQATAARVARTDQTPFLNNLRAQVAQIKAMVRQGGRVVTGTDAPIDSTAVSLHMNLRAMVAFGLTPYEALVTATRNSGELLGEPLGRVAPGMYADLCVLGGDPLTDIKEAANVRRVIANGRPYEIGELLAPYTAMSVTTLSNHELPPVPEHPANAGFWWHASDYLENSKRCCRG